MSTQLEQMEEFRETNPVKYRNRLARLAGRIQDREIDAALAEANKLIDEFYEMVLENQRQLAQERVDARTAEAFEAEE